MKPKYIILVIAGVLTFGLEGWLINNDFLETLGVILCLWGIVGDILQNVTFTKSTNVNTDKVIINQDKETL